MEVDFNFNNKVMAKIIMDCTEQNNLLKEKYRSHKEYRAIYQAINKQILYDIVHLQCRPMILYSNNVTSCYDWIVYYILSITL